MPRCDVKSFVALELAASIAGGDRMREKRPLGRKFLVILLAQLTAVALVCWATIPDFSAIEVYRITAGIGDTVDHLVPDLRTSTPSLYLPQAAGTPIVALDGKTGIQPTSNDTARLTRRLQMLTMAVPDGRELSIVQPSRYVGAPLGPVYLGPDVLLQPVIDQQLLWGALMQAMIPAAAACAILISLLLIFFSRQPSKYMALILAYSIQMVIELEYNPALPGFRLIDYSQALGVMTQLLIWTAIVQWTEAKRPHRIPIITSGVILLIILVIVQVIGANAVATMTRIGVFCFAVWLVGMQIINWRLILAAQFRSDFFHAGALASFLISQTGLLAYSAIGLAQPTGQTAFFLSNWVNVATAFAVIIFVIGALLAEVQTYRQQRQMVSDLGHAAAGHHLKLTEQQAALRGEIERNAVLEERQRFVRDLHDGIGNQLLGLLIKLRGTGTEVAALAHDVQTAIADLRLVASALDAPDGNLDQALIALHERLRMQASPAGVQIHWNTQISVVEGLPQKFILDVLRIVQECVGNALRHADPQSISVQISGSEEVTISVEDDGCGFDFATVHSGLGLRNIRTRAASWHGTVAFGDSDGRRGTSLTVTMPVPHTVAAVSRSD